MNQSNIRFKLRNIDILEFSFKNPEKEITQETVFRFDTRIEHFIDTTNKLINIVSSFQIYCDELDRILGEARISIHYQIEDFEITESNNLPEQFLLMLNSISLSTCRGVLFALFRGTPLHSVILPVINPKNLQEVGKPKG